MMKKLSTTQRLFNRNDKFIAKRESKKRLTTKKSAHISVKEVIDPEKEEMYQLRKLELQQKAL